MQPMRQGAVDDRWPSALPATRLATPAVRANAVPRPRLTELLQLGLTGRLTAIIAPAGFGKTTLISQHCAARATDTAWLTLDRHDNDPPRFWRNVVRALLHVAPDAQDGLLQSWSAMPPPSLDLVLDELIVATADCDALLVLDDYHVIDS